MANNTKSVTPRFPRSIIGHITITAFSLSVVTAFVPGAQVYLPFSLLTRVGVALFGSVYAIKVVVGLGGVAHLVEGLHLVNLCKKAGCSTAHTLGWFGLASLYGWPAVMEFQQAKQEGAAKRP